MANPRRKTTSRRIWLESLPGRSFDALLARSLGSAATFEPSFYRSSGGWHGFCASGSLSDGMLAERLWMNRAGSDVRQVIFTQERSTIEGPGIFKAELITHRPLQRDHADEVMTHGIAWWKQKRARIGDELDRFTCSFEPNPVPGPATVGLSKTIRFDFTCADCGDSAGVIDYTPPGQRVPMIAPEVDLLHLSRLVIWYAGAWSIYAREINRRIDDVRDMLGAGDLRSVAQLRTEWAPFFCLVCERCYCGKHWTRADPSRSSCSSSHVVESEASQA